MALLLGKFYLSHQLKIPSQIKLSPWTYQGFWAKFYHKEPQGGIAWYWMRNPPKWSYWIKNSQLFKKMLGTLKAWQRLYFKTPFRNWLWTQLLRLRLQNSKAPQKRLQLQTPRCSLTRSLLRTTCVLYDTKGAKNQLRLTAQLRPLRRWEILMILTELKDRLALLLAEWIWRQRETLGHLLITIMSTTKLMMIRQRSCWKLLLTNRLAKKGPRHLRKILRLRVLLIKPLLNKVVHQRLWMRW